MSNQTLIGTLSRELGNIAHPPMISGEAKEIKLPLIEAAKADKCRRSFRYFVEAAWHIVFPATPFKPGIHIDAICLHMQALVENRLRHLLISIPPRHGKSSIVAIFFPAWVWATYPGKKFMFVSYSDRLSTRDSRRCRILIESTWYRQRWGDKFKLADDSNKVIRFDNTMGGFRFATSVTGQITGEGADFIVCDDMNNLQEINSVPKREKVKEVWDDVLPSRLDDPETGHFVVIAQRGHDDDLIGHILRQEREAMEEAENDAREDEWAFIEEREKEVDGPVHVVQGEDSKDEKEKPTVVKAAGGDGAYISDYEYLRLPAFYEHKNKSTTSIGWEDPRNEDGQLLAPDRFTRRVLLKLKRRLGSYSFAAQYQQRPVPLEGGVFDPEWWQTYKICELPPPALWSDSCISIDMSFGSTKESASYVVAQAWVQVGARFYLVDQIRGQWKYTQSKAEILAFCRKHFNIYTILVEDKANGPAVMDDMMETDGLSGVIPVLPKGTKEARAHAVSPLVEAKNVFLPEVGEYAWVNDLLLELALFPRATNDDQVDSLTQALDRLRGGAAFGCSVDEDGRITTVGMGGLDLNEAASKEIPDSVIRQLSAISGIGDRQINQRPGPNGELRSFWGNMKEKLNNSR